MTEQPADSNDDLKALFEAAIVEAQRIGRQEGFEIGQIVAHPDDANEYELQAIEGNEAIVCLADNPEITTRFPLAEIFSLAVMRAAATRAGLYQILASSISKDRRHEQTAEAKQLPHEPNRGIIGFTQTPEGRKCIGMTIDGTEYILLRTCSLGMAQTLQQRLMADQEMQKILHRSEGIKSILGTPFDIDSSLRTNQLELVSMPGFIGVYVEAKVFDQMRDAGYR